MATAADVAKYILEQRGPMTTMKLQKLVYYSQAWSLVWDQAPIFAEKIRAWSNGPVISSLYAQHRGRFQLAAGDITGNSATLTPSERETVDAVLGFYGDKSAQWLSDLTHREAPWREARQGLDPEERGDAEITLGALAEYYGSIDIDDSPDNMPF